MRLQVFLSQSGVCSRRKALEFIKQGLVKVNSSVNFEPGTQIDSKKDKIEFRDKEIKQKEYIYVLFNKPKGVVTTKEDRFAPKKIFDLLPQKFFHLNPCGRLDKDTTGLILLTNDGELLYRMTHPKFEIKKTYFVKVFGRVIQAEKKILENGVIIERQKTRPCSIKIVLSNDNFSELLIEIKEGKKRQIRLMFEKIRHPVSELMRIKEGRLSLENLEIGQWRFLSQKEVMDLYKETGLIK